MRSAVARGIALLVVLALPGGRAQADELTICYNYGCYATAPVDYSEAQLERLRQLFAGAENAAGEREVISAATGKMYAIAGEQTPVWRDKGGNYADSGENGRMDCIDHSTNTSAFLALFQARGWLRFHEVLPRLMRTRFIFADHWAARIRERETQKEYIVDSWFVDNGQPAAIMPLEDWLAGKSPNVH